MRRSASDQFASDPFRARVRRKVPGLFVFMRPAGGIGIRACLRSMNFRVRIPGGVPDFLRKRMRLRLLFYNLDVAKTFANAGSNPAGNANSQLAVAQRPARVVRDDE